MGTGQSNIKCTLRPCLEIATGVQFLHPGNPVDTEDLGNAGRVTGGMDGRGNGWGWVGERGTMIS